MDEMTQLVLAAGICSIVARYTDVARLYAERRGNETAQFIWWIITSLFFWASCSAFVTWFLKAF